MAGKITKNELHTNVKSTIENAEKIGDLTTLTTTAKDTIVNAIKENTAQLAETATKEELENTNKELEKKAGKIETLSLQSQINSLVLGDMNGDGSAETVQARVDTLGSVFPTMKSHLDNIEKIIREGRTNLSFTWEIGGIYADNGVEVDTDWGALRIRTVEPIELPTEPISVEIENGYELFPIRYDMNGNFVSKDGIRNVSYTFIPQSNFKYRFELKKADNANVGLENSFRVEFTKSFSIHKINELLASIDSLNLSVNDIENGVGINNKVISAEKLNFSKTTRNLISIKDAYKQGYYNNLGQFLTSTTMITSDPIYIDKDTNYIFRLFETDLLNLDYVLVVLFDAAGNRLNQSYLGKTTYNAENTVNVSSATYPGFAYMRLTYQFSAATTVSTFINSNTKLYFAKAGEDNSFTQKHVIPTDYIEKTAQQSVDDILLNTFKFVNVKKYGAVGNGTTYDTVAFQKALDLANTLGEITIYVPDGTYLIGICAYYPNTRLILSERATLKQGNIGYFLTNRTLAGDATPVHSLGYLEIYGGTFYGEYVDDDEIVYRKVGIQAGKLSRLIVKGTTFKDACAGNHLIDMSGCANVLIEDCNILGMHLQQAQRPTTPNGDADHVANLEMLQIDVGKGLGVGLVGEYAKAPSKNVVIRNCEFGRNEDNPQSVLYRPIGIHMNPKTGEYYENIIVENNTFKDPLGRVIGVGGTRNCSIKNNHFINSTDMIDDVIKFIMYLGNAADIINTEIENNTVEYTGNAGLYGFIGVDTYNAGTSRIKKIKICGNDAPNLSVNLNICDGVLTYLNDFSEFNTVNSTKIIDLDSLAVNS